MNLKSFHVVVRFDTSDNNFKELTRSVKDFFDNEVSSFPGFISAKFHTNDEHSVFLNYATWESKSAYQKFLDEVGMKSEKAKKVLSFNPTADQVFHIEF
jgi:hypothetical protein